ncbi:MAG: hypothetical protein ACXAEN_23830 [Candidatus Thorarchaeota archaeon]
MSLNYSLEKIKDFEDLYVGSDESGWHIKGPYQSIIFSMMSIDMQRITEDNFDEVLFRSVLFETMFLRHKRTYQEIIEDVEPVLRRMIGLSVNVTPVPRSKWLRRMMKNYEQDITRSIKTFAPQKEVTAKSGN